MSLNFTLDDLSDYTFDTSFQKEAIFRTLLRNSGFRNNTDSFAVISCGGTISSAYSPLRENIRATNKSPVTDVLKALNNSFGIANKDISTISLLDKDSRDITTKDLEFILNFINSIKNERIALTCGTYGLPLFTQIIGQHATGERRVIGITGSMLISSMKEHDVDFNAGAVTSSINALHNLSSKKKTPTVFASFHGEVYTPDQCEKLNLHPKSHSDTEFYRGQPL